MLYRSCLEHKICLVGLDNAGKTTILYQFLMNEVVHTSPTIGSNVEEVVWNNIHFIMWDLGGQESLRTSWNTYYSNTEVPVHRDTVYRDKYCIECIWFRMILPDPILYLVSYGDKLLECGTDIFIRQALKLDFEDC